MQTELQQSIIETQSSVSVYMRDGKTRDKAKRLAALAAKYENKRPDLAAKFNADASHIVRSHCAAVDGKECKKLGFVSGVASDATKRSNKAEQIRAHYERTRA